VSLRWKTVILVIASVTVIVGILFATSQIIVMRGFQQVENRMTASAVEHVTGIISDRVQHLNTLNNDWAAWDDTYDFVQHPDQNQNWVKSNTPDNTFKSSELNLLLVVDLSGNLVFGKAYDLINDEEVPLPQYMDEYILSDFLLSHANAEDAKYGIVATPAENLLLSSQPVVTSQGQGPVMGTVIMAQILDSRLIGILSGSAQAPIEVFSVNDNTLFAEYQRILASFSSGLQVVTRLVDSKTIAGYELVKDISGQPAIMVKTTLSRDVYASGTIALRYFYITLLIVAIILGILLYFVIGSLVISRVSKIGRYVSDISVSGDLTKRLSDSGKDELARLGTDVNKMVDTLKKTQDALESKQMEAQKTNEDLVVTVHKLEQKERQSKLLSEMRNLLQACATIQETPPIIMSSMKKLFPAAGGSLFLLSPSRSDLESVASWGDFPDDVSDNVFAPDACWGLRRGSVYIVENTYTEPLCPHVKHIPSLAYTCLPLVAKSDVLGLLHIRVSESAQKQSDQNMISDFKDMANTISEYLSLSIANIKLSESLANQSIRDALTGLFNKRYMEEFLQREILRAARKHTPVGIIMGDLDHFKQFNDNYGHQAGDKLLSQVGELLLRKIRGSDVACRYGGEEFVVFLPDANREDTVTRAEELRRDISDLEVHYQGQILSRVTISMGISMFPDDGANAEDLLRVADAALYRAKHEGRNRVVF